MSRYFSAYQNQLQKRLYINLIGMTGHENLFKVIPGLLSDVNTVHQTSISLLIVAPESRFGRGCGGYINFYKIFDGVVLNLR